MLEGVKPPRHYDSSGRRNRALQNRLAVLEAGRRSFLAHGYTATTVPAIAAEAAVSVETIYKAFGNKAGLLKAIFDVALVGDDEPVELAQREFVKRNMAEPDPRKKLAGYARFVAAVMPRIAPVQLLAKAGASTDAEVSQVWDQMCNERLVGMERLATNLEEFGSLRPGLSIPHVRDLLWVHGSPEMYELLVVVRGWPNPDYESWLRDSLVAVLLAPQ